ncbi:hypothetical protein [Nannocystis bainbridge]|uniref:Secreted protein n=1 Tax=Nannocystis bainbridge TaxID=2995303 RepID=A0ABT5E8A0_9BACT|nr:hypothetical protein [Nannocystis bainbridge]MDC0722095.1 hypothetical protein [Nannocystis bainbridge]
MLEAAVVLVLCAWGIATIFYQFKATSDAVARWNFLSLIPKWTFFAPRPKTTDYQLLYQDRRLGADSMAEPVEISLMPKGRVAPVLRFLWNPCKRNTKAINDITGFITNYKARHRRRIARNALALEMYVPYLVMLNYVSSRARAPTADCRRRFIVRKSFGHIRRDPPVPVLESNFHRVEALS